MLMENYDTKRDNDANGSDQKPNLSTARSSVKLRNTCQFSRSLVNWCCDNRRQEDRETWTATGSNICSGFSSCVNNKVHGSSYNLSNNLCRDKNKKSKRTCSTKANAQRDNDLYYFVRAKEQFEKNHEDSSPQEKTQKLRKQSTAVNVIPIACTGQVFANNGGETVFGFKHFAEPEDVLTDYINAYVYKRSRLEKVDKKKISDWIIELQNILKDTSEESNEPRRENTFRGDKLGTKILKLGKRSPMTKFTAQRTTATSNFVFELGALDGRNLQNNKSDEVISTIEGIKGRRTVFDAQENARDSKNNKKADLSRPQKSIISLLPKLSSEKLQQADGIDNSRERRCFVGKTVLPNIDKWRNSSEEKKKTQKSSGIRNKLKSPRVDRNTTVSRSNWEILKQRRNLTHGKDCDNSWQRKKLCDTLEKLTRKICNEQHSYPESKTDNYCDEITVGRDNDNRPKGRNSSLSKVFDNGLNDTTNASRSDKNNGEGRVFKLKKEWKMEKYLDEHSRTLIEESNDDDQEEEIIYPSSKVVADILARLDIHDVGFHIDAKKDEKSVNAATSARKYENSRQILIPEKLNATTDCQTVIETERKPLNISVAAKCGRNVSELIGVETRGYESELVKNKNKSSSGVQRSYGTSQTEKIIVKNKSAFIEMGLKGLEDRIPKHLGTQILKSDYLRKDLSLKPANFFRTHINFNDPLNSCLNLTLSIGNSGSDTHQSSQQDELFKQKIQRIMRGSMKDEGETTRIITKKFNVDNNKNYKKLSRIINEKFAERKDNINYGKRRRSFVEKFLDVQTEILMNPRLRAVLPVLVDGIKNLVEMRTR